MRLKEVMHVRVLFEDVFSFTVKLVPEKKAFFFWFLVI